MREITEVPECSRSNSPPSSESRRSSGAPVSLLVMLHAAFRRELAELKRVVGEAAGACGADDRKTKVVELRKKVEFLRSVYKYHCIAEAEVIFLALDARVENIACTYYMQHSSTDSMFDAIVSCLNVIINKQPNPTQELREVTFQIGTLRDSICQHMAKEEKQVFPLLMRNFSHEEQASLVWQFICNFPVMLLEDLFRWLASSLSPEEQLDLKGCVNSILTEDKCTLKELLNSWINKAGQKSCDSCIKYNRLTECRQEHDNLTELSNLCLLKKSFNEVQDFEIIEKGPIDGLLLWHAAIRSEFQAILNTLNQGRLKKNSSFTSVIVQIKFLNEVLIYYSNILEKMFYPLLEDASLQQTLPLHRPLLHKNEVRRLQNFLNDANDVNLTEPAFLEKLCCRVENLALVTTEHLSFQESEVFPLISGKYNHESQQKLLIRSLCILPLGLLKCVISWFSSHLSKDILNSVLNGIEQSIALDKPFALLLKEWVRSGYSGKTDRENLQEVFSRTMPYTLDFNRNEKDPCNNLENKNPNSVGSSKKFFPPSVSRTSGTDLFMFSSSSTNMDDSLSGYPSQGITNNILEPMPMDHIYYFHKAIKKDLELLVLDAPKLSKNLGLLMEFTQHFEFVRSLYELHSETEDKVAFPVLEANPNARNLTQSYSIDHEMQAECFKRGSRILDEMSSLYHKLSGTEVDLVDQELMKYHLLCLQLEDSCKSLKKILEDHILREETELWPLFREYFSIEEQVKILGYMLGRTRAQILQQMIEWLMAYLTLEEQRAMMSYWIKATHYTKFSEWLGEWWEGMKKDDFGASEELATCPSSVNFMDTAAKYPSRDGSLDWRENLSATRSESINSDSKAAARVVAKSNDMDVYTQKHISLEYARVFKKKKEEDQKNEYIDDDCKFSSPVQEVNQQTKHLVISEDESAAATKMLLHNSWLDLQAKARVNHNISTSQCLEAELYFDSGDVITCEPGKLPGQFPSYRDTKGFVFGCKHYKQNCKLVASCCNRIFTCRRCHDEEISDHVMERKSITQMMCMKCLQIQRIGRVCSTPSCNEYSMARYYCRICRLFDDEREIYHCPYCNLCRVGKGLGIDYFHCMKCNACMGRSLSVHKCIEKCIEDKCPICQEDLFTSTNPVKSLNCGHVMHSTCFQDYTCMKYTCPICSKSLGDMQVYFKMLDALLAEEKMPDEYSGKTQAILCNDCAKKGTAPFHWLYHKCPLCGSYNTRLL